MYYTDDKTSIYNKTHRKQKIIINLEEKIDEQIRNTIQI